MQAVKEKLQDMNAMRKAKAELKAEEKVYFKNYIGDSNILLEKRYQILIFHTTTLSKI